MCCCSLMQVPAGAACSGQQAGSGCAWGFHPGPVCCLQQATCMVLVQDGRQTCVPVWKERISQLGVAGEVRSLQDSACCYILLQAGCRCRSC